MIPRHPILAIVGVLGAALLALTQIVDLQTGEPLLLVDPSTESLLPTHDPGRVYLDRFKETFAVGDTIILSLEDDDIFTAENLARIQRISEAVEALPEVDRATSLSLSINIRSESGELVVEPFYRDIPETAAELADLRQRALSDPIYAGNLVSRDGRISQVIVHLLDISDLEIQTSRISRKVREIAQAEWSHATFRTTGSAHIKTGLNDLIVSDMTVIVPITWIVMAIVAYVAFRSILAVIATLVSIQLAVLMTIGLIGYLYGSLNQVTAAVPSVLFVVGLAYAIHILAAYYDAVRELRGRRESESKAVRVALEKVVLPVVFTGLTTAAGFFSLATSSLEAVQQYGVSTGAGTLITMLVALVFVPAFMQLMPIPKLPKKREAGQRFDRWLEALAGFDIRNRNWILMLWLVVGVISFAGMFRIQVGYGFVDVFKPHHPVRAEFEAINTALEGANGFNVVLETSVTEGFKDPENLALIDALQVWLAEQPEIGGSTSLADYIKALYQGIEGGDPSYFVIPDTRELVSQLLVVGENEEIPFFVDSDFQTTNISIRTTAMNSRSILPLVERIEEKLEEIPPHIQTRVTGDTVMVSRTLDDIAYGQATSMLTAFVSIFAILMLLFTSVRSALVALVPNVLPVLMYFGILGWAGVELNTTTSIVACVVFGIAVDDTIHLLAHFTRGARQHADELQGVTHALLSVGRPVTFTTAALCLGSLCMMFSQMQTQIEFGWLAAVTLAGAWLVDMTFTPALVARLRIVTLWDVVSLDLGQEPQKSIPLFDGLTANQARFAASLATIDSFEAGDQVFKVDDPGDFLYVVIDGELKVSVQNEKGEVLLNELSRGSVVGEIALFSGVRSANVEATTRSRLLRLGLADFARIQRRRPRIGAQLYANLSRAQAQRLVRLTSRVS